MAQAGDYEEQGIAGEDSQADCMQRLADAQQVASELKDKYLRAAAQAENTRKWTERSVQARADEQRQALLRQLLEVTDNLERALANPTDPQALNQGVQITLRQMMQVLERAGVERIDVESGQPFDPSTQEAVEVRAGSVPHPLIVAVVQPGYSYNGKLLRPARVVVVK